MLTAQQAKDLMLNSVDKIEELIDNVIPAIEEDIRSEANLGKWQLEYRYYPPDWTREIADYKAMPPQVEAVFNSFYTAKVFSIVENHLRAYGYKVRNCTDPMYTGKDTPLHFAISWISPDKPNETLLTKFNNWKDDLNDEQR